MHKHFKYMRRHSENCNLPVAWSPVRHAVSLRPCFCYPIGIAGMETVMSNNESADERTAREKFEAWLQEIEAALPSSSRRDIAGLGEPALVMCFLSVVHSIATQDAHVLMASFSSA